QELTAAGYDKLYYWTSGNTAEVDFILSLHENVYPFEIKSGFNTKAKSLKIYKEKYKPRIVARASLRNFSKTDNVYDYPLYAVSLFPLLR
ncbi:MAG: DUF4143 domain-containing protein, partial [Elusimicrobiota bacterium]|nr:DUF4143 domain-containing protein [Elusimicrobiota bacterium]